MTDETKTPAAETPPEETPEAKAAREEAEAYTARVEGLNEKRERVRALAAQERDLQDRLVRAQNSAALDAEEKVLDAEIAQMNERVKAAGDAFAKETGQVSPPETPPAPPETPPAPPPPVKAAPHKAQAPKADDTTKGA